ncbi:hypothetical protein [Streptomyces sp. NPDC057696]|uniref:hypothetical protein n=1 Tax=Streptomyces sp. NPDC057696 TaxID=3346218 RepID=UPI00367B1A12
MKQPEFLTIAVHGGQEARTPERTGRGFPTNNIEEDEAGSAWSRSMKSRIDW